jgi:hypothetical protein
MYKPPVCECGKPLYLWEEYGYQYYTPIPQKGLESKRGIMKRGGFDGSLTRLRCDDCGKEYDYSKDSDGRFIRGLPWDQVW